MNGVEMITKERKRQITKKKYDAKHDDDHNTGELARAAACYAAPEPIFTSAPTTGNSFLFSDPFPVDWYDGRFFSNGKVRSFVTVSHSDLGLRGEPITLKDRINELAKAGALCAAEIDRLKRLERRERVQK